MYGDSEEILKALFRIVQGHLLVQGRTANTVICLCTVDLLCSTGREINVQSANIG